MNSDMNGFQAKAIADILLFMVVAIGLFALVANWPAARFDKEDIVQKQNLKNIFSFDFRARGDEKLMRFLQASEVKR